MLRMARSLFLFLLVTLSHYQVKARDGDDHCVRLTSAFNYEGDVYLVSGNEYFQIDSSFAEVDHGTLEDKFDAPEGEIDAALGYDDDLYFFKGFHYYSYNHLYYFGTFGAARDNSNWDEFLESGLDAAVTLGESSYFFHGCEYAKGHESYNVKSLAELGLPCHVDAAWNQDGKIYITLENNVWVMDENEHVTGPEPLSELLTMTTCTICGSDPFEAKIRAEQKYEREHNCTIIDAAITWKDTVYVFNNDDYITLNDEGDEIDKANVIEWGGLSGNIDAGIVWLGDDDTYFFKGDHYCEYYALFCIPRSNSHWSPFFLRGIDAAASHGGTSYFFKGCKMVVYESTNDEDNQFIHSPDLNLPCDVDAAFSREGTLYAIKGNQVWTWRTDEEVAVGPASLSTAVSLMSWTPCPPEEED